MTKIKICGIRTVEDALYCVETGADAIGFVFADSPRQVSMETARRISASLPPFISRIGVFVDTEKHVVERIAHYCGLTALQFHGGEDPLYCRSFSLPVLKAARVKTADDINALHEYAVSAFVLDAYHPCRAGGTGVTFDWSLADKRLSRPIILAGGLKPDNVALAIQKIRPYAVDVSSGVETAGAKDREKIKAFINAVRRCA